MQSRLWRNEINPGKFDQLQFAVDHNRLGQLDCCPKSSSKKLSYSGIVYFFDKCTYGLEVALGVPGRGVSVGVAVAPTVIISFVPAPMLF